MKVIPRHLATRVERALGTSRVVNIVGPRQAGKTTLVKDLIATARYITLDDDAMWCHSSVPEAPSLHVSYKAK